jgi:hypothetical protein
MDQRTEHTQVVVEAQIVALIHLVDLVGQVVEEQVLLLIKEVLQEWQGQQILAVVAVVVPRVILHL